MRFLSTGSRMVQPQNWAVKTYSFVYHRRTASTLFIGRIFGHSLENYLAQFETTARLCNLDLQMPVYTCGISYADRDENKIAQQKIMAKEHASRLIALLRSLSPELKLAV